MIQGPDGVIGKDTPRARGLAGRNHLIGAGSNQRRIALLRKATMMPLQAGSATTLINCEINDDLSGQYHRRLVERVRDDLEANAFYLTDGSEQILLINLDLAGLFEITYVREVGAAIEAATGVPARSVILCSTHTRPSPSTRPCSKATTPSRPLHSARSSPGWSRNAGFDGRPYASLPAAKVS